MSHLGNCVDCDDFTTLVVKGMCTRCATVYFREEELSVLAHENDDEDYEEVDDDDE